jgi:hypothetical protein
MFSLHHHDERKDHDFEGVLDHSPTLMHQQDAMQLHDVPHFDPDEPPPPDQHHEDDHHHHHQLQVLQEDDDDDHHLMEHHGTHNDDNLHHHQQVSELEHGTDPNQMEHPHDHHSHSPPLPLGDHTQPYDQSLEDHEDELGREKFRKRRRYDNDFKARVLGQLKIPGSKLSDVSKMFEVPENTVREWTKVSVVQSIEAARHRHGGALKANGYDPLQRLNENLVVYFERNAMQQDHLKQPITTKLIVSKGLESRNHLLELNEIQPFLDPKEKKALQKFMGSDSWAKKFARRYSLRMSGTRVKELADDDVRSYIAQLRQLAGRVKQGGPGYDEAAALMLQAAEKLVSARIVAARRMGHSSAQIIT